MAINYHLFEETEVGVPQGGNLSPILSNIMLNELDKELERRGHKFMRYADDLLIFCKSRRCRTDTGKHTPLHREEAVSQSESGENVSG